MATSLAVQLLRGCHEVHLDAIVRLLDAVGGSVLLLERHDIMMRPTDDEFPSWASASGIRNKPVPIRNPIWDPTSSLQ